MTIVATQIAKLIVTETQLEGDLSRTKSSTTNCVSSLRK